MTNASTTSRDDEPVELYAIHDREELREYCELTEKLGVKIEVEAFHYGGVWNAMRMIEKGLLERSGLGDLLPRLEGRLLDARRPCRR